MMVRIGSDHACGESESHASIGFVIDHHSHVSRARKLEVFPMESLIGIDDSPKFLQRGPPFLMAFLGQGKLNAG